MLEDSRLPTAIYLKNRSPTQALKNKIPEELWTGKNVDLSHLRVFSCEAHILIPKEKRTSLELKTQMCIFVGYFTESKDYRLIDPTNPRQITIYRYVIFMENKIHQHPESNDALSSSHQTDTFVPMIYLINLVQT